MVNIRTKGQTGERDVIIMLETTLSNLLAQDGSPVPAKPVFQRNQNQSAVGGSDITNPFGLCIEVKRQEQLSINTWWKQCLQAANEFGGVPILIFKQNRLKWRVIMHTNNFYCDRGYVQVRSEITIDDFLVWLHHRIKNYIEEGKWST